MTNNTVAQHLVFCGDSVTDCARKRAARYEDQETALGNGWVHYVHRAMSARYQDQFRLWNRGFSGSLTQEIMTQDLWWPEATEQNVQSSLTTLMIGINDIWHPFWKSQPHEIESALQAFQELLKALIERSQRVLVLEPIALPCGDVNHQWWEPLDDLSKGQEMLVGSLADCEWLPLQESLLKDAHRAYEDYLYDGVHPSDLGHRWLSKQWLNAVMDRQLLKL